MAVELPTDWLTPESMVTLAGASAGVMAVANTVWKLTKLPPMWVGVIASLLIAGYGAYSAEMLSTVPGWIVMLVNACVLFSMAFGIDESLASIAGISKRGLDETSERSWLRPWI